MEVSLFCWGTYNNDNNNDNNNNDNNNNNNGGQDHPHHHSRGCTSKRQRTREIEKYQLLSEEIRKLPKLKKVTVVLVVIASLVAVSDMFDKHMEKLGTTIRLEVIQKTALLGMARLLRYVLSL